MLHRELNDTVEAHGSPHTLVITAAALRASHIVNALKQFQSSEVIVAKLFAKHIAMAEAVEMCNSRR